MKLLQTMLLMVLWVAGSVAYAAKVTVKMHMIDANGIGRAIGTVLARDSKEGLVLQTNLKGLPPGEHGFHVHESPDCAAKAKDGAMTAGLAAGGHYDPDKTGRHEGPTGMGHRGDLPLLVADSRGVAKKRLLAPHLKVADLRGRSLMIHAGGDNYSDDPRPLGGGGARIACGVVK